MCSSISPDGFLLDGRQPLVDLVEVAIVEVD